jgi:hypothetical protein
MIQLSPAVIARSEATKQSIPTGFAVPMDCFAPLAMTEATTIRLIPDRLSALTKI